MEKARFCIHKHLAEEKTPKASEEVNIKEVLKENNLTHHQSTNLTVMSALFQKLFYLEPI